MSEQKTLYRTLEMMAKLSITSYSTKELAEMYDVSPRSIQRTIKTIRDAGYVVNYVRERYQIDRLETKRSNMFDISELLHFSKEEAWMLHEAIERIPGKNAVKEKLVKKLYSIYGSDNVANNLIRQEDSEQYRILAEAIQHKLQVIVTEYTMSTANKGLQDVIIEPIKFETDNSRLWAFYPKRGRNFLLRLSGIHGVKALYQPYEHEMLHKPGMVDVFRGYGFSTMPFKMIMNRRAYGFLLEEYPMAVKFVTKTPYKEYMLETEVCDLFQPGRFFMGLPGDMKVLEPANFKEYIGKPDYNYSDEEDLAYAVSGAMGDNKK